MHLKPEIRLQVCNACNVRIACIAMIDRDRSPHASRFFTVLAPNLTLASPSLIKFDTPVFPSNICFSGKSAPEIPVQSPHMANS
jgi:hypothetical protein